MNNKILQTNNYSLFGKVDGNRTVNPTHVNNLKISMKKIDLKIPIVVNDKMQVIDGQHRLKARQELGFPVFYIIVNGLGLSETQRANSCAKNWNDKDYLDSYVQQNFSHYKSYKKFRETYQFGHSETLAILSGKNAAGGNNSKEFREGEFSVSDLERATEWAEKIYQIEPYYKGFKRRSFLSAIIRCFKHDQYVHEDFISKLSYQSSKLVDCTSADQYLRIIDEIYNFKRKPEDKIRFF